MKELKAEIERQREINFKVSILVKDVPRDKKLITELADALEELDVVEYKHAELLQRAREATKHE